MQFDLWGQNGLLHAPLFLRLGRVTSSLRASGLRASVGPLHARVSC